MNVGDFQLYLFHHFLEAIDKAPLHFIIRLSLLRASFLARRMSVTCVLPLIAGFHAGAPFVLGSCLFAIDFLVIDDPNLTAAVRAQ